jgi:cation transport ATPase
LQGILLKGGHVLDALASCHTIAFDKTGTLTTGGLLFKAIEPIYGHDIRNRESIISSCCIPTCEKEALAVAAAMEKGTTHPIGRYHFEQNIFVLLLNPPRTSNSCSHFASFIYF